MNSNLPCICLSLYKLDSEPELMFDRTYDGDVEYLALVSVNDIYLQGDQVFESLGPKGADLLPSTIVKRLAEHLY